MKKLSFKRIIELGWLAASVLLILVWVRSVILNKFQYPWESWLRLPWQDKLQPLELLVKRDISTSRVPDNPADRRLTEADLDKAMRSAADWLLTDQENSGHFKYWYDPVRDEYSIPPDDSFHRQAMADYALVQAYEMTGVPRYLESVRRNLEYLYGFRQTLEPDMTYFYAGDQADLGGAALPMLIMIRLRELTGSVIYDEDLRRLANFLIFLQGKYNTGEFKSTYVYKGDYQVEKRLDWQSPISPGQAMLALSWMYRNFHDSKYKDSIDRGLHFYSNEKYWKQEAFLPWTIAAFTAMYSETHEKRYADYVTQLADYLTSWQNVDSGDKVFGSFGSFPSITSASFLEGLGDAMKLTGESKDSSRNALYRRRAQIGYRWLMSLQYGPDKIAQVQVPSRANGGFAQSMYDPQIRIDYNGHAISALAQGLRLGFGREPIIVLDRPR